MAVGYPPLLGVVVFPSNLCTHATAIISTCNLSASRRIVGSRGTVVLLRLCARVYACHALGTHQEVAFGRLANQDALDLFGYGSPGRSSLG